MAVGDEPPEHGEQQPGEHEAGEEGEQGVAPSPVQDRHEHVLVWGSVRARGVTWAEICDLQYCN